MPQPAMTLQQTLRCCTPREPQFLGDCWADAPVSPPTLVAPALNVSKLGPSQAVSSTQGMGEGCQRPYWFCLASSSDLPSLPPGSQLVQPHANTTAGNEPFPPSASPSLPGATVSTCPDPDSTCPARDSREQTCPRPSGRRGRADPLCTPGCAGHPSHVVSGHPQTVSGLGEQQWVQQTPNPARLYGCPERGSHEGMVTLPPLPPHT